MTPIAGRFARRQAALAVAAGLLAVAFTAVARNMDLAFFSQPGGEHGFDNEPGDPRSREIVRAAVEFRKTNLRSDRAAAAP